MIFKKIVGFAAAIAAIAAAAAVVVVALAFALYALAREYLGPAGAAAGLVLQGVLGKPIGKAMGSRYHVSGSWEKPEITLIAKETLRRSRPESKPQEPDAKPQEPEAKPADGGLR